MLTATTTGPYTAHESGSGRLPNHGTYSRVFAIILHRDIKPQEMIPEGNCCCMTNSRNQHLKYVKDTLFAFSRYFHAPRLRYTTIR